MGGLIDAMAAAMEAIIKQAETELGIASPSSVFQKIGGAIREGLAIGISGGSSVRESVTQQFNLAIHTSAPTENVVSDFGLMVALAGGR
jgi:hypothetical protein